MSSVKRRSLPLLLLAWAATPSLGQWPTTTPASPSADGAYGSYSTFTGSASNASQSLAINFPGHGSFRGPTRGDYDSPPVVVGPGGWWPVYPVYPPPQIIQILPVPVPITERGRGGLILPMPPARFVEPEASRTRRPNPARAREQIELGDRAFRGGNTKRAEDRFIQAAKADPSSATPHVHLAQVSLVRKDYTTAAEQIRSAVAAAQGAGWLANVPDIQSMFAEPGDFTRQMARLESHLQANPGDRDAWFLLGVEWYLSGRTQQAADAFRRLTDRRPDESLEAFLDASRLARPAAH